jgi:hypothetical protein
MVNRENDCVNLVFRCDHCLILSLMRNHITSASNNKNKKQITMLKRSVAVGIQIEVLDSDNVDDKVDDDDC